MPMMKYDAERGAFLAGLVEDGGFVAGGESPHMRKMFGHESWFFNGYMFTGANEDGIFVHLGERTAAIAIAEKAELRPFSPGRDVIMKDYALIAGAAADDPKIVAGWVRQSADYLAGLPRKEPKKKKTKKQ
jgi:TfoX/Sxy family transcriptional regulator of competence genes